MKIRALLSVGVMLASALATTGCALNPDNALRDRLGVQAATMALIERADNPAAKAQAVVDAAESVRSLMDLTDVSVGDLRNALLARLAQRFEDGKVSPLERLAALEAINAASTEVERRIGVGLLTAETRVTVNTVLTWVQDAAAIYVPHKATT